MGIAVVMSTLLASGLVVSSEAGTTLAVIDEVRAAVGLPAYAAPPPPPPPTPPPQAMSSNASALPPCYSCDNAGGCGIK